MTRDAVPPNVRAFLALIRQVEANGRYDLIAGGEIFTDFSEHPFIVEPNRPKPLGTTAAGGYQMVRKTWSLARDNLGLPDFSPESQDRAAIGLLKHKVPGRDQWIPEGTGIYELVVAGDFDQAIARLAPEWEAFGKMIAGRYHVTLAQARELLEAQGGTYA